MYPTKHFMDFVQILFVGFSILMTQTSPQKGRSSALMQSYNVNPIEDLHQKLFGNSIFRHTDQQ
jgi:hypothetical protein